VRAARAAEADRRQAASRIMPPQHLAKLKRANIYIRDADAGAGDHADVEGVRRRRQRLAHGLINQTREQPSVRVSEAG
jgi:hypothetical protein